MVVTLVFSMIMMLPFGNIVINSQLGSINPGWVCVGCVFVGLIIAVALIALFRAIEIKTEAKPSIVACIMGIILMLNLKLGWINNSNLGWTSITFLAAFFLLEIMAAAETNELQEKPFYERSAT